MRIHVIAVGNVKWCNDDDEFFFAFESFSIIIMMISIYLMIIIKFTYTYFFFIFFLPVIFFRSSQNKITSIPYCIWIIFIWNEWMNENSVTVILGYFVVVVSITIFINDFFFLSLSLQCLSLIESLLFIDWKLSINIKRHQDEDDDLCDVIIIFF